MFCRLFSQALACSRWAGQLLGGSVPVCSCLLSEAPGGATTTGPAQPSAGLFSSCQCLCIRTDSTCPPSLSKPGTPHGAKWTDGFGINETDDIISKVIQKYIKNNVKEGCLKALKGVKGFGAGVLLKLAVAGSGEGQDVTCRFSI